MRLKLKLIWQHGLYLYHMLSYWEKKSFTEYDYIVAGAGIVGLSTAIELRERYPERSVLVVERGVLPTGASTRNAGFACMGSVTELLDDLTHGSEEEVRNLFERRKKGLSLLRERLGDTAIGYAADGSYELISAEETDAVDKIDYLNRLLAPVTDRPAFALANEKIKEFGFASSRVNALIQNCCEGSLNTGKMMRALWQKASTLGVLLFTGVALRSFEEQNDGVLLRLPQPSRDEELLLRTKKLLICTNAFAKELLPEQDILPGRGQVLITRPVPHLRFKGIFHFDKGYYYFRELDGRVLIGGGRNLDFAGETTVELALNDYIQNDLERQLREMILPHTEFEIDQRWSGIMAFGQSKKPIVKAFSNRVFSALGLGGMGVALGSLVAQEVVTLAASSGD